MTALEVEFVVGRSAPPVRAEALQHVVAAAFIDQHQRLQDQSVEEIEQVQIDPTGDSFDRIELEAAAEHRQLREQLAFGIVE